MNQRIEQSKQRRQRVLEAACAVFSAEGYKRARIEDIAERANVSKGLLYTFFSSKQKLYETVLKQELLEWLELTAQLAANPEDPLKEMEIMFTAVFDILQEKPLMQAMLRGEKKELARYWPVLKRLNQRWRRRIISLLEAGINSGQFRPELDATRTADIIHSLQRTYLDRALGYSGQDDSPDPKLVAVVGEFISNGIKT